MAEAITGIMAVENKYAGLGWSRKQAIKKKIDQLLKASGIEDSEINAASALYDSYLKYEHTRKIVAAITQEESIPITIKHEAEKLLCFSKSSDINELHSAAPIEFRNFIDLHGISLSVVEESIKDYEYFLEKMIFGVMMYGSRL